ncbi:MAG: SPFH domain-containing protein [Candidatus Jorgensenbacteria bacterium]
MKWNERTIFALDCWSALFLLPLIILPMVGLNEFWIGVGVWLMAVGSTGRLFVFLVPEVTGAVALNLITGELKAFPSGIQFKYPWERALEENYFSLKLVTQEFKETYAAEDGPMMLVRASYQYRPDINRLDTYIAVDKETIKDGFSDVVSSVLSGLIGKRDAQAARTEVKEIEQEVIKLIDGTKTVVHGNEKTLKDKLETQYGVNFQIFSIPDIDFSEDYQAARSGVARAEKLAAAAVAVQGKDGTMTRKEAMNFVLVEQQKAAKNIFEIEGTAGGMVTAGIAKLLSSSGGLDQLVSGKKGGK